MFIRLDGSNIFTYFTVSLPFSRDVSTADSSRLVLCVDFRLSKKIVLFKNTNLRNLVATIHGNSEWTK